MTFTRLLPVAAVVMLAAHATPNIARALPGQPFQALREQFEEYRAPAVHVDRSFAEDVA